MAATPVGKQAEEFKFFCPLCMMFYRTMREMPCCQQYTQRVEGRLIGRATAIAPLNSWGWPASILAPSLAPTRAHPVRP